MWSRIQGIYMETKLHKKKSNIKYIWWSTCLVISEMPVFNKYEDRFNDEK